MRLRGHQPEGARERLGRFAASDRVPHRRKGSELRAQDHGGIDREEGRMGSQERVPDLNPRTGAQFAEIEVADSGSLDFAALIQEPLRKSGQALWLTPQMIGDKLQKHVERAIGDTQHAPVFKSNVRAHESGQRIAFRRGGQWGRRHRLERARHARSPVSVIAFGKRRETKELDRDRET